MSDLVGRLIKTDWHNLREKLIAEFPCDPISIHGPGHWKRVEGNGLLIAPASGAIVEVVRLFALFHDCRREHDGWDDTHGARGAEYARSLRGKMFELPDEQFDLLHYACTWHTHGQLSEDPTIGTCWDADRLDLGRVGMRPSGEYMSTAKGKDLAGMLR
jgi:uncharacterized protein